MSRQKLDSIRAQSCYPAFRGFVSFFALIGYLAAGLVALASLLALGSGKASGIGVAILGIVVAVVLALVIKAATECSLMLADIADCTVRDASAPDAALVPPPAAPPQQNNIPPSFPPPPSLGTVPPVTRSPSHEPTLAELIRQQPEVK